MECDLDTSITKAIAQLRKSMELEGTKDPGVRIDYADGDDGHGLFIYSSGSQYGSGVC